MKERPILFSATMVRAILEGRKTQTRRMLKNQKLLDYLVLNMKTGRIEFIVGEYDSFPVSDVCPYGQSGDRLWVRETWCDPGREGWPILYRADFPQHWSAENSSTGSAVTLKAEDYRWKPSIHMFRDFSRITLEVTEVRVERLNTISAADARAEGVSGDDDAAVINAYAALWEEINGMGTFDERWVWVISFRDDVH